MTMMVKPIETRLLEGEPLEVARDIKRLEDERERAMNELNDEYRAKVQSLNEAYQARRGELWEQMHDLTETNGDDPWQIVLQFLDEYGHAYLQRMPADPQQAGTLN